MVQLMNSLLYILSYFYFYESLWSLCCLQARANRDWSTSASTSAFPATSACPCASTTCQSDRVHASSPSSKRSGKQSCLFSPPRTHKHTHKNKNQLWPFPLCQTPASKPVKQPTFPAHFFLPREKRWRQVVMVIAKGQSSLSSCVIPSLVAHFEDYRRTPPTRFLDVVLIVYHVTHCCRVTMCNCFYCDDCSDQSNKRLLWRKLPRTVRMASLLWNHFEKNIYGENYSNFESNVHTWEHFVVHPSWCEWCGPLDKINMVHWKKGKKQRSSSCVQSDKVKERLRDEYDHVYDVSP